MRRRIIRVMLMLLLLLAAVAGWAAPAYLHPIRRELTPELISEGDASFAVTHADREQFDVRAPDAALLRGGYGVAIMDARAHGASEGSTATYGWLERNDTRGHRRPVSGRRAALSLDPLARQRRPLPAAPAYFRSG